MSHMDEPPARLPSPRLDTPRQLRRTATGLRPGWQIYGIAVVATAAALLLRRALSFVDNESLLELLLLPVILSAYLGGLWPGLLATGLGAMLAAFFLLPPLNSLAIRSPSDIAEWAFLVIAGALISVLSEGLHRAWQRSAASRRLHAVTLDSISDAIISTNASFRIESWNRGAEALYGWTAAEAIGRSMDALLPTTYFDGDGEQVKTAFFHDGHWQGEVAQPHKDGLPLAIQSSVSTLRDGAGRFFGAVAVNRDITERKRAEEALRESEARLAGIVGSAMDAIISVDAARTIQLFNRAAEQVFRCPAAEALGTSLDRFVPPAVRERHAQEIRDFAATGVTSRSMGSLSALTALRADGEEFPIEATISQVLVAGRQIFTVIVRDITARQEAEAAVLRLNEELERRVAERTAELEAANKELEAFSYSVSHDLRAPLRAIDGFSRILQEDYVAHLPPMAQEYFQLVRSNAQQMGRLVDDLLAFSRLSRQPLAPRHVDHNLLVRQCVDELQVEANGRQIQLSVEQLPAAQGDPALLKQVWINLLANALKYTRRRAVARIEVGSQEHGAELIYFVRDNGVGFDMRYSDKLFGVFQRMHRAEEYEGTGVGLAIVQRIVHRHGGRVWADAEVERGATFSFTLGGQQR
jgi:PAS domain S-box-containing protein